MAKGMGGTPTPEAAALSLNVDHLWHLVHQGTPGTFRSRAEGCSLLYLMLVALHTEKGGDIARLWRWSADGNRTQWRHEFLHRADAKVLPLVRTMLRRWPSLAGLTCMRGVAGATPLHVAGYIGLPSLVSVLLEHGANPAAPNLAGLTPIDEAMHRGNGEAVRLLLRGLPSEQQAATRVRLAEYVALHDSPLRPETLGDVPLPHVPRRKPRIDPLPADPQRAACAEAGGWNADASRSSAWEHTDVDMRVDLSEGEYFREYFLKGRPLLIRNAVPLHERCTLALSSPPVAEAAKAQVGRCGATAYPELTGRHACGTFAFIDLRQSPRCDDARRTRPVCNWKLGRAKSKAQRDGSGGGGSDGVDTTPGFREMPARLRHPSSKPPLAFMRPAWAMGTSRALWGGTAGSGSGFHYHNAAVRIALHTHTACTRPAHGLHMACTRPA